MSSELERRLTDAYEAGAVLMAQATAPPEHVATGPVGSPATSRSRAARRLLPLAVSLVVLMLIGGAALLRSTPTSTTSAPAPAPASSATPGAAALIGTTWTLDDITTAAGAILTPAERPTAPTVSFPSVGQWLYSDGCRRGAAPAEIGIGTLVTHGSVLDSSNCGAFGPGPDVVAEYADLATGEFSWAITGRALTVTAPGPNTFRFHLAYTVLTGNLTDRDCGFTLQDVGPPPNDVLTSEEIVNGQTDGITAVPPTLRYGLVSDNGAVPIPAWLVTYTDVPADQVLPPAGPGPQINPDGTPKTPDRPDPNATADVTGLYDAHTGDELTQCTAERSG